MRTALITIALHAALVAALLALPHDEPAATPAARVAVEVVDIVVPPRKPAAAQQPRAGGGAPAAPTLVAMRTPAPRPRVVETVRGVEHAVIDHVEPALSFDGGGDGGRGHGAGGGDGDGIGAGTGIGVGSATTTTASLAELVVPAAPPPAPVSKARPARLVYPARNRDAGTDELFVARVVVDHEGYVVGARLVHGFGDHRDEQASQLVWRFRYDPARDDEGRRIRSTVDQSFLVGR